MENSIFDVTNRLIHLDIFPLSSVYQFYDEMSLHRYLEWKLTYIESWTAEELLGKNSCQTFWTILQTFFFCQISQKTLWTNLKSTLENIEKSKKLSHLLFTLSYQLIFFGCQPRSTASHATYYNLQLPFFSKQKKIKTTSFFVCSFCDNFQYAGKSQG